MAQVSGFQHGPRWCCGRTYVDESKGSGRPCSQCGLFEVFQGAKQQQKMKILHGVSINRWFLWKRQRGFFISLRQKLTHLVIALKLEHSQLWPRLRSQGTWVESGRDTLPGHLFPNFVSFSYFLFCCQKAQLCYRLCFLHEVEST